MKEREKERYILERMEWNKEFGGDGGGALDDGLGSGLKNNALMSEFE